MKIGIIGLGKMGQGIARNLLLNENEVYVFDINEEVMKSASTMGATSVQSPLELSSKVDIIFTSLPLPKHLVDVLIENGLIANMKKNSIIVDVSTIDPETAIQIKEEAEKYEIEFLACPLGKGPKQAHEGTLPIFVGGNKITYKRIISILKQLGEPFYLGGVEQSTAFKLISNMIGMTNLLAMSEGFKLAKTANINLDQFKELLKDTGANSAQLNLRSSLVLESNYNPMFSVDLAKKDITLGVKMAEQYKSKTELCDITLSYLKKASETGYGSEDCAAVYKVY